MLKIVIEQAEGDGRIGRIVGECQKCKRGPSTMIIMQSRAIAASKAEIQIQCFICGSKTKIVHKG